MVRHIVLGVASAAAIALAVPAAQAADLPPAEPAPAVVAVPSFTWTGPYVGIQGGYAWQRSSNIRPTGWMLGGYLGVNYQVGQGSGAIFGLETDINYADIDDSRTRGGVKTKVSQDWNGATRARLGFAFDRFLAYGAAGIAYGDRELKRRPGGSDSKTAVGWTVGGGVEVAVADNVALRTEYRYTDYGKDKFNLGRFSTKSSATEHRVMGGVAWKFNSPF